jgi:uncharacterized protein HemX
VDLIAETLPGLPALQKELPLLLLLVLALAAGFGLGTWLHAERLRQAEWRIRRAEAMCNALRKLSDDYRKRLSGRSPQQAERKLKEQERKLGVLRFQVASLSSELKSMRPPSSEVIDLIDASSSPRPPREGRC